MKIKVTMLKSKITNQKQTLNLPKWGDASFQSKILQRNEMLKLKNNGEMKWVYGQRIGRKEEGGGSLSCHPWGRREAHNFDEKK